MRCAGAASSKAPRDNNQGDQACQQQFDEAEALLTRHRGFLTLIVTSRASPGNRVTAP